MTDHIHEGDGDYWAACRRCYHDQLDGIPALLAPSTGNSETTAPSGTPPKVVTYHFDRFERQFFCLEDHEFVKYQDFSSHARTVHGTVAYTSTGPAEYYPSHQGVTVTRKGTSDEDGE